MRRKVLTMRANGRPLLEIAQVVGVSVAALRRYCRTNGISIGHGRPRKTATPQRGRQTSTALVWENGPSGY
jgi:hypothetical protein